MNYPETVVIKELMWEYDYTEEQASSIVDKYKKDGGYTYLCELIQYRLSLKNQEESLYVQ